MIIVVEILSLNDALTYGLKFAEKSGADQIEGYSCNTQEIAINVEKIIPTITNGVSTGISFRVVANSNTGFAYTKTLTKERIEFTIKTALQNAKAKGKDPDFKTLPNPSKKKAEKFEFDKKLESITSDQMAEDLSTLISTIDDTKDLHYLQGQIYLSISDEHLINSNGIDIQSKGGGLGGYGVAITTKGLIPNYSFGIKGSPSTKHFKIDDIINETITQTKRAAGPKTMNFLKEVPVILEPEASLGVLGSLLQILSNQLNGNNVASGATPYSDQVGNQIAVDNFTFVDNGINSSKLFHGNFDAEGVPREKTILVENGILKTFLLDTYYGNKLGLESNGKSTRGGGIFGFGTDPVKSLPSISTNSLEVLPGNSSRDEMIEETKEGFMLRTLMGLHMSDQSSGRFSVTGFGWYIKNGEIKYPVHGIDISGMLPDLLKSIDLISKEREEMILADAPYIRFANVPVTTKKFDLKTRLGLGLIKVLTSLKLIKNPLF